MKLIKLNGKVINVGEWDYCLTDEGIVTNPLPEGAVEVEGDWPEPKTYAQLREAAYIAEGITPDAIAIAIAERDGEGRPEAFAAIQAKRAAIKERYPKPV